MFYKDFQAKRKEMGLTIEQVAQKIKINPDTLKNIEAGEFTKLPDIYVRLFIKSYARELGLNPDEYLKKYETHTGSKKHDVKQNIIKQSPKEEGKVDKTIARGRDKGKTITFIIIFVLIIFVIIILKQVLSENQTTMVSPVHQRLIQQQDSLVGAEAQPIGTPEEEPAAVETQPVPESPEQEQTPQPAVIDTSSMLSLGIEIADTCWVKIVIDESDTSEALFRPGTVRKWQANRVFDLRIGRPEVVKLFLNDTELDSVDRGIVPARVVITEDGIINR
ncbi:MAG: RodZ domain-containing protein [Fidelibacterota bacterium]